jgi:outer membrane protein TolC
MTCARFFWVALLMLSNLVWPAERVRAAPAGSAGSMRLTPRSVVRRVLKHNLGLKYERLAPELTGAAEQMARSGFDTTLFSNVTASGDGDRLRLKLPTGFVPGYDVRVDGDVGVRRVFSSGTRVEASFSGLLGIGSSGTSPGPDRMFFQAGARLTVRHPLLLGSSKAVNEVNISTARLDRSVAHQQLRRKAEEAAVEALKAYWDLHTALASLRIQEVALKQSQKVLEETRELIKAQKIAASEAVEATHQVKTEERATLLARQTVANHRDKLARLMGLSGASALLTPAYTTAGLQGLRGLRGLRVPTQGVKELRDTALKKRGDFRALQLTQKSRKVELGAAKHALLPAFDLVGSVGAYGNNNPIDSATDPTLGLVQGRVAWTFGFILEIPLSHRDAKAKREVAHLRVRRAAVSLEQKQVLISEELKVALRGLKAAQALMKLAETSVKVAGIKLANALQLYRSGKTPGRLVALVRADLVQEQLTQQQAVATLHKALVDVWATTGTLLQQVGGGGGLGGR